MGYYYYNRSRAQQAAIWGGVSYLLRDEFTSALAAGSVDGTAAEPGPGTRTVVDTDGDALSIAGGVLTFANTNNKWGNPGIRYASVARVAGRILIMEITPATNDKSVITGFYGNATPGTPNSNDYIGGIYFRGSGDLETYLGAGNSVEIGSFTGATSYIATVIMKASGVYLLIKGGTFTTWTLLWTGVYSSAAAYPTIADYHALLTLDYIRIPDILWLPTPTCFDSFTRANGALGVSETSGPDSQAVTARTWNNRVGTTQIATNKASASALVGGLAIATVDTSTVDTIVSATLTRAGNEVGVVLRYADADNYIRAVHDGTNCKLIKRVATAETDVISAVVAIGAGAIRVIPDGTSFSLFLNNAKVGSTSTISDAGLQTGTEQGLFSTNTGNTQDAFEVFGRGTLGEYSDLDKY